MKRYNIAVVSTGYVEMSLATLLAQHNCVTAVDLLPEKVDKINSRIPPPHTGRVHREIPRGKATRPQRDT